MTETAFWKAVDGLDGIKTPDCPDSWLLAGLDEELSNAAAKELTDAERWHLGMGCARCHRIIMLAHNTRFGDIEIGERQQDHPNPRVIEFRPRTPQSWQAAGTALPLVAGIKLIDLFPILYDLDGGNIKLRIGSSDLPGQYQVDIRSNLDLACVLRLYDGAPLDSADLEIVWPVMLYTDCLKILPLTGEHLRQLMRFRRIDAEISESPGGDAGEGDTLVP